MSQEIDNGTKVPQMQNGIASNPLPQTENLNSPNMCALSVVFVIIGVAAIIFGCCVGLATYITYDKYGFVMERNFTTLWLGAFSGIIVGTFNFALAVIVDACNKYRKSHKD